MECIYIVLFSSFNCYKVHLQHKSAIHTLTTRWLLYQEPTCSLGIRNSYTHLHTNGTVIVNNLGFNILPEDTSACSSTCTLYPLRNSHLNAFKTSQYLCLRNRQRIHSALSDFRKSSFFLILVLGN